ncbi:hypothetical protein BDZ88DRAFT_471022 [Geranomyces variabilis]|nr:hypothetical protein BDZ88DRAFT_471022 [Geranomyces variabilis]
MTSTSEYTAPPVACKAKGPTTDELYFTPISIAWKSMPTSQSLEEWANEARIRLLIENPLTDVKTKKKLRTYMNKNRIAENKFAVEYTYSANSHHESGRLYARNGIGLQFFPKDIRAYIAGEYYNDIDTRAALPTALKQVFKWERIDVPELDALVADRERVLLDTETTKQGVLADLLSSHRTPKKAFYQKIHAAIYKKLVPIWKASATYQSELWKHIQKSKVPDIKGNRDGCFVALAMQTLENQVLMAMVDFFNQRGFSADVALIFDGLLVPKDPIHRITSQLLDNLSAYVKEKTKIDLRFVEKSMDIRDSFWTKHGLDKENPDLQARTPYAGAGSSPSQQCCAFSPVAPGECMSVALCAQYHCEDATQGGDRLLQYLNHFFAKVTHEEAIWYGYREKPSDPWQLRDDKATKLATEHLNWTDSKGKNTSAFAFWRTSPELRLFRKIVMDPSYIGDRDGKEINLFRGFQAKTVDASMFDRAKIEPLLWHNKHVLNGGDEECANYTLKWLASIFQKPAEKNETAIAMFSEQQGTGKSLFYEFIGNLMVGADHFYHSKNLDDFIGQFTGHLVGKIFVIGDEILFSGGHKSNNIVKALITQGTQKCEKKGKDAFLVRDFMNMVFLSNHDDCVRVEKTDRRYFVKMVSDIRHGDADYFHRLKAAMTQETANQFYTYLMGLDLSNFNVRKIPETVEKKEMMAHTMTPLELFVRDLLDGTVVEARSGFGDKETTYFMPGQTYSTTMNLLYERYVNSIRSSATVPNKQSFSQRIRKQVNIVDETKDRHGGMILLTVEERPK